MLVARNLPTSCCSLQATWRLRREENGGDGENEDLVASFSLRLDWDPVLGAWNEPTIPTVLGRLGQIIEGHWNSRYGPTETHRESYEVAGGEYSGIARDLKELIADIEKLEQAAEAAGVPWTPGRRIP